MNRFGSSAGLGKRPHLHGAVVAMQPANSLSARVATIGLGGNSKPRRIGAEVFSEMERQGAEPQKFVRVFDGFFLVSRTASNHHVCSMTDFKTRLGRVIKQLRNQRGLTQDELAHKASLHRTYVSDVERGTRNLSITSLSRISSALETPLAEVFKQVEA